MKTDDRMNREKINVKERKRTSTGSDRSQQEAGSTHTDSEPSYPDIVPKAQIHKEIETFGDQLNSSSYKKLKHKLMHHQVGFEGQLRNIGDKFSDNVARMGAAAIYEQHIYKTVKQ